MSARLFRLTQMHQRIDDHLRSRAPRPLELVRLVALKARVKRLIARLTHPNDVTPLPLAV